MIVFYWRTRVGAEVLGHPTQHPGRRCLVLLQALSCPQVSPSTWSRQRFEEKWGTMSPISSWDTDIFVLIMHR